MWLHAKALVLLAAFALHVGCGGHAHGRDDGGDSAVDGGLDSGDGGESCTDFHACGGEPSGRWEVVTTCGIGLEAGRAMLFGAPECNGAVRRVEPQVTGTYVFTADGGVESDTILAIDMDLLFTNACVSALAGGVPVDAQGVAAICSMLETQFTENPAYDGSVCNVQGTGCACMLTTVEDNLVAQAMVNGSNLDNGGGDLTPFCVVGDTLKLLRASSDGNVVLTLRRIGP